MKKCAILIPAECNTGQSPFGPAPGWSQGNDYGRDRGNH